MATVELTTSARVPRRADGVARTARAARRAGRWNRAASRRTLSVWVTRCLSLETDVAVKFIRPDPGLDSRKGSLEQG